MKLTRQSVIAASTLLLGGFIGASALVAAASSSTWVPAPSTPPNCDTSISGCNAPINVGAQLQQKIGWFASNGLITNNLYVASGTTMTANSVLTNDGAGNAKWAPAGSSNMSMTSGGDATNGYWYRIGDLLIQGGTVYDGTGTENTLLSMTFPKPFSTVASVQLNPLNSGGYSQVHPEQQVLVKNITTTGFDYKTIENNGMTWLAVGTALDVVSLSATGVTCKIATSTSYTNYTFNGTVSGSSPTETLYYFSSSADSTLNNRSITIPGSWQQPKSLSGYSTQSGQYIKITSPYSSSITIPCTL